MSKSWPMVKLGEVLVEQKARIGSFDADGLTLLGVSNQQGLHRSAMPRISDMSRYLRVERSWFAYNPMRINVGSLGYAYSDDLAGVISPDYVVFSCSDRVLPEWVHSYLRHPIGLDAINAATAGSVRERLYFSKLAEIEIPLPPLAEQRRIVARIEQLAEQIHEAKRLRKEAEEEAEAMMASEANAIFTSDMAHTWKRLILDDIADIRAGVTLGRRLTGDTILLPYLRVANVQDGYLDLTEIKEVEVYVSEAEKWSLQSGDILLTEGGDWDKLGRGTIWRNEIENCIHQNHVFRVRALVKTVAPEYLAKQISSPVGKAYFQSASKQTTNLASINQRQLKAFPVLCPPLPEQRRIVAELDALQAEVDGLKRLQAETSAELDALLPAILDRAFKGEL